MGEFVVESPLGAGTQPGIALNYDQRSHSIAPVRAFFKGIG
jgi:hypothetical protein